MLSCFFCIVPCSVSRFVLIYASFLRSPGTVNRTFVLWFDFLRALDA